MEDKPKYKNSCYTYFKISGDFKPEIVTQRLGLMPNKYWNIGDKRKNGTTYDFASWVYGRCDEYDVYVENQMMKTIEDLIPKVKILQEIRKEFDVEYFLEIVPSLYVNETVPCLAPNREIIKFCYETKTNIDIDLYLNESEDK